MFSMPLNTHISLWQVHKEIDSKQIDDGTAALVAWVRDTTLLVANAGDSRAVLGRRGGQAVAMSRDHKPEDPSEGQSIRDKGGFVTENGRVLTSSPLIFSPSSMPSHVCA